MQKYRALLMGGVCLGLVSIQAGTGIFAADEAPAAAAEPQTAAPAAAETPAKADEAAPPAAEVTAPAAAEPPSAEEAAPAMTPSGVTWYSGDTTPATPPAFAAEATMNPDYSPEAAAAAPAEAPAPAAAPEAPAAAEAPAEAAPAAAEAPAADAATATAAAEEAAPPMTPPGVTWYSGDTTPATPPAFAAEATMNPDYTPEAAATAPAEAPAASAEPAVAAEVPKTEDPVLPMTPPGITEFFGDTSARETMPFRAEATVYPSTPEPASAAPATQAAVEACRDALNAEALAGKINFATSAWDVLPDSFKTLDKIAKVAKDCSSNFVIEVGGHTDNTGKPASNKTISELRAQSVAKYLTKAGVDAAKLKAVGYGEDNPIGDNGTVAGRRENRRIAFTVTGG